MRILIVDDDAYARRMLRRCLRGASDVTLEEAAHLASARQALERETFDAVLLDVHLGEGAADRDGLALLGEVRDRGGGAVAIVVSASSEMAAIREAMRLGAHSYVLKDELCEELMSPLLGAVRDRQALREEVLRSQGLLGDSAAMARLRARLARVAAADGPVLVQGPTGAGKERVAEAIHRLGPRRSEPLVAVNCAAFTESLVEAQLFGYEKGFFTGADRARAGVLAEVGRGTLLLDEIAELSPALQSKLLRVLENRTYRVIGAGADSHFAGRIVAATHVDLAARVAEGRFRADLLYRLDVLSVAVPALCDRREDIPALAAHFGATAERSIRFVPDALDALAQMDWPGNVRQLRNFVTRLSVFADAALINAADVAAQAAEAAGARVIAPAAAPGEAVTLLRGLSPRATRKHNEAVLARNQIACLEQQGEPVERICAIMGIGRATYFRIKKER